MHADPVELYKVFRILITAYGVWPVLAVVLFWPVVLFIAWLFRGIAYLQQDHALDKEFRSAPRPLSQIIRDGKHDKRDSHADHREKNDG
jgi:hypothetical protein